MLARITSSVALLLLATLTGCETSTHLLVGQSRPPISPDTVQLFLRPPAKYETIALISAEGKPSWALTSQQQVDVALGRLKAEAAMLGANGILLQGVSDRYNGSIGSGIVTSRGFSALALGSGMPMYVKELKGVAIYVQQDNAASTANSTDDTSELMPYETNGDPQSPPRAPAVPSGVRSREIVISRDLRASFGPGGQGGLLVTGVEKGGPAARAGIRVGDVITAVDGQATAPYRWENAAVLIMDGEGDSVRLIVASQSDEAHHRTQVTRRQ